MNYERQFYRYTHTVLDPVVCIRAAIGDGIVIDVHVCVCVYGGVGELQIVEVVGRSWVCEREFEIG